MIETDRQLQIIKQYRAAGGYGHKASNAYTAGIPDLAVILPGFMPHAIEVKDLGEVGAKFSRKVNTTPLQRETMERMNKATGQCFIEAVGVFVNTSAFVIVTYKRGRAIYAAFLPWYEAQVTQETTCSILSDLHNNLPKLLHRMGVPSL